MRPIRYYKGTKKVKIIEYHFKDKSQRAKVEFEDGNKVVVPLCLLYNKFRSKKIKKLIELYKICGRCHKPMVLILFRIHPITKEKDGICSICADKWNDTKREEW